MIARVLAMQPTGLIVADGARCRLFAPPRRRPRTSSPPRSWKSAPTSRTPRLCCRVSRNRSHPGGPAHGYDDHRDRHHAEMLRRFAREIAAHAERLVKDRGLVGLVLVTDARLLGFLREQLPPQLRDKIIATLDEAATKKSVAELRELLEQRGLLPAAPRPKSRYRPRGQPS